MSMCLYLPLPQEAPMNPSWTLMMMYLLLTPFPASAMMLLDRGVRPLLLLLTGMSPNLYLQTTSFGIFLLPTIRPIRVFPYFILIYQ
ncbi:hypothetical protein B0H14DRAFT_2731778 [Mycena olivaceomarginata]|nr:hypothetical protein B0H14DRAFT_2731778 [Mycena olivaceomarginata]